MSNVTLIEKFRPLTRLSLTASTKTQSSGTAAQSSIVALLQQVPLILRRDNWMRSFSERKLAIRYDVRAATLKDWATLVTFTRKSASYF